MTTTVKVKGMSCNHCVMAVTKALNQVGGVEKVDVHLDKGEVAIDHSNPIDMASVQDQIEKAGFEVG
jgi:copper chaperone